MALHLHYDPASRDFGSQSSSTRGRLVGGQRSLEAHDRRMHCFNYLRQ